jgi:hypothetical protein
VIASPRPGRPVRSVKQRLDLGGGEERDGSLLAAFRRDREHALDQCGVLGVAQRGVLKERVDGGEADVAGPGAVAALVLEVLEERPDRGRVELRELKPRGWRSGLLLHEGEQQPERVAVAGDRVRADAPLAEQPVGEICLKRRGEGRHGRVLSWLGSSRLAASASSSGAAVK